MNLPNKLTVLRMIMVPFFVLFMLTDIGGPANKWITLVIFCVASLTDMLDGKIARARNLVTNFGKFMDPLADNNVVIAASYWGKFKTVSQMFMIILLIADLGGVFNTIAAILVWVSLALTVISLVDYIGKNIQVLTKGGM